MNRLEKIDFIKSIIAKFGSISMGELEIDCSPAITSMGSYVLLVDSFALNCVGTEIYNTKWDFCESGPEIKYEDLENDVINQIYDIFLDYENEFINVL